MSGRTARQPTRGQLAGIVFPLLVLLTLLCGCEPKTRRGADNAGPDSTTEVTSPPEEPAQDTWDNFARDFIADRCLSCHFEGSIRGDFTTYEGVAKVAEPMRCGVASTQQRDCEGMPPPRSFPTGPRPPEEDLARLVRWLDAGMPR